MEPIEPRKLFVGGVSRETTGVTLREHFSQYGTVEESFIVRHRLTGLGRGFGFVIFSSVSMAEKALEHRHPVILGKQVEVQKAEPKGYWQEHSNGYGSNGGVGVKRINTKKIYVGGLPHDLKCEEFKSYFESFGTVTDAAVMTDKKTGRPRGFGFITFDSEDAAADVLQNTFHKLKNKMVEVKSPNPKDRKDDYMNRYDCNNTSLVLGGGYSYLYNNIYYLFPAFQTYHQCYCGWNSYEFGGWGSPSNLIGPSPSRGQLAYVNPAVHSSYVFCPSCGVLMNGYCNGRCHQMAESTASGISNGSYDSGVEIPETRKSHQIDDLSSLKISALENQEEEEENGDLLNSKSDAEERQKAEIHDSTVQKTMLLSTKSEQNGHSSLGSG